MSISYNDNNTIIFSFARMNPPTPGHLYVIQRLIEEAIKRNISKVYIFLSKTNDNNENPISCEEKLNILGSNIDAINNMTESLKKQMIVSQENNVTLSPSEKEDIVNKISRMEVNFICVPNIKGATPFTPLSNIIYNMNDIPDINLILIIGEDRADRLDSIASLYFFKRDNVNSFDGIILDRPDMGTYKNMTTDQLSTLDISSIPVGAFSASFVRKLVKNGFKDKFTDVYKPYLDQAKIDRLYTLIQSGLNLPENKKKEPPSKPLKFKYPLIKGNQNDSVLIKRKGSFSNGGKNTKRYRSKTYKKKLYKKESRKLNQKKRKGKYTKRI